MRRSHLWVQAENHRPKVCAGLLPAAGIPRGTGVSLARADNYHLFAIINTSLANVLCVTSRGLALSWQSSGAEPVGVVATLTSLSLCLTVVCYHRVPCLQAVPDLVIGRRLFFLASLEGRSGMGGCHRSHPPPTPLQKPPPPPEKLKNMKAKLKKKINK